MLQINIEQFEGYDEDGFKEFLTTQNENEYELLLPKDTIYSFSDSNELAQEYGIAAYVGQLIFEISDSFSYQEPSVATTDDFVFTFSTNKIDELAETLLNISYGFGNSEDVEVLDFNNEAESFVKESKNKPVACQSLLDTFYEHFKEEDGNSDDDE